jgi:hypothetical protein
LPDGLFKDQKSKFWYILEGLGMENVGIFYGHLVKCMAVWCSLCSFGIFFPFWYVGTKKNLATLMNAAMMNTENYPPCDLATEFIKRNF